MKKDLILILLLLIPAVTPLFQPGFFSMHDDLQSMRQLQMAKCFTDGQIPCRWVPDLGLGFGFPLFNFYPPLPYYLGQIYHWIGFSYQDIIKVVGVTGFAVTAIGMYFLAREFWGRGGGVISALFYSYAPYHSVDFYVRGAMNEFWAIAFFPLIFWSIYRSLKSPHHRWIILLSLSLAGLMLSHNLMLMIFFPLCLFWTIFWFWRFKNLRALIRLFAGVMLGFGLASFFTLPVIFETKFIHVETLISGYFYFLQHFVPIARLFIEVNWGYGASNLGQTEHLSYFLGFLHWLIPALLILLFPFKKQLRVITPLLLLVGVFLLFSLFMTHSRSFPIWNLFPSLAYLQFPWRFLSISIFSASLLCGAIAKVIPQKALFLLIPLLLLLNANFFQPREWYLEMTDAQKFSGQSWQKLTASAIFDYLPIWAPQPPADAAGGDINITKGYGTYLRQSKNSQSQSYLVTITSPSAVAELQTYFFPGWRVWIDGVEQPLNPQRDPLLGRIQVDLSMGTHHLLAKFTNTPIRTLGNLISVISGLGILGFSLSTWLRYRPKQL